MRQMRGVIDMDNAIILRKLQRCLVSECPD